MKNKMNRRLKKISLLSSTFILISFCDKPIAYAIELDRVTSETSFIEEPEFDNSVEQEEQVVEKEKIEEINDWKILAQSDNGDIIILSEEKTADFIMVKGKSLPNYSLNSITLDNKEIITETDEEGNFQIELPKSVSGSKIEINLLDNEKNSISTLIFEINNASFPDRENKDTSTNNKEIGKSPEDYDNSIIESSKEDKREEKEVRLIEKPIVKLDDKNNKILGTSIPHSTVEVWKDAELFAQILIDDTGDFSLQLNSEMYGSVLSFITILSEDEKSEATELVVEKNRGREEALKPNLVSKSTLLTSIPTIAMNKGKTYHYVKRGETAQKIADAYKITLKQLLEWNPHIKNINQIPVGELISIDGLYIYNEINKEKKIFTNSTDFINYIAPIAQELASKNGLYASVMIAQAAHESGWGGSALATMGNNLSGVKGSYNGNSIVMLTWEEINGKVIWIEDYFRLYPSYREALNDYVDKLVNGLTYDRNFYRGTWVENTASYMDATEWLTGRYATDSQYGAKLNAMIRANNLTRFDTHVKITDPIHSQRYITYAGTIKNKDIPIYSEPYGTASDKLVANSSSFYGKNVIIKQEKVNNAGTWAKIYNNNELIGWINKKFLMVEEVLSTTNIQYAARVVTQNHSIDSQPYGVFGFVKLGTSKDYYNEQVIATQEKVTPRGTYVLITHKGKDIGWIDKRALNIETVTSTNNIQYAAKINTRIHSIDSQPYGVPGFTKINVSGNYYNEKVIATQEKVTPRGTFVSIIHKGKFLGWIDKRALIVENVIETKNIQYAAKIVTKVHSIDSEPYGIPGFIKLANSDDYYNESVIGVQEKVTPRGTFVKITHKGKSLGWVDKRALSVENVLETKNIQYAAKIITKIHSIDSQPYGIPGFIKLSTSADYYNESVIVSQEKVTPRGIFVNLVHKGKNIGWIDKRALDIEVAISSRPVSYGALIITKNHSIDTLPYGVEGFRKITTSQDHYEKRIIAKNEVTTRRGTFVLASLYGKELGWIDKRALEPERVLSEKDIQYAAEITGKNNTIDSMPYGTSGFQTIARTTDTAFYKKKVVIKKEVVTQRGTFSLAYLNDKKLGWIDKDALEIEKIVSSKDISYIARVITKSYSIDSKPYGIEGFTKVADSDDYFNQIVTATKEVSTSRGVFVYISIGGRNIGWVDKRALEI